MLAIGDNLNTDIKGANLMNYDSLFIINGIHKKLFLSSDDKNIKKKIKNLNLNINFYQHELKW